MLVVCNNDICEICETKRWQFYWPPEFLWFVYCTKISCLYLYIPLPFPKWRIPCWIAVLCFICGHMMISTTSNWVEYPVDTCRDCTGNSTRWLHPYICTLYWTLLYWIYTLLCDICNLMQFYHYSIKRVFARVKILQFVNRCTHK